MRRAPSLVLIFVLLSLQVLGSESRPNILFINVNDTNDFVGFMGSRYSDQAITPKMDALAEKGVAFTNAHCATPACTPSRHALFYGKYPFTTGLYRYNFDMREAEDLVRQDHPDLKGLNILFREQGYTTYAFGEILGILEEYAVGDEWSYAVPARPSEEITFDPERSFVSPVNKQFAFGASQNDESVYGGYRMASEAIEILAQDHPEPFFLAVGIYEAHLPLPAPPKYFDWYDDFELLPFHEDDLDDVPEVGVRLAGNGGSYQYLKENGAWEIAMRSYLAMLSYVDAQVGRIIEALEHSPHRDNTIVVLWSDHGTNIGRKLRVDKFTLWEPSTRVPLIIWDTRNPDRTGICAESTSLVDLYPTLLSLTNMAGPTELDGMDLTPWLDEPTLAREQPAYTMMGRGNYSIRNRDWRYTRYFDGGEELYHNKVDREELTNLIDDPRFSDQAQYMRTFLPEDEAPMVKLGLFHVPVFRDADEAAELDQASPE